MSVCQFLHSTAPLFGRPLRNTLWRQSLWTESIEFLPPLHVVGFNAVSLRHLFTLRLASCGEYSNLVPDTYVAISWHLRHVRTAVVGATWVSAGFTLHLAASTGVRMTSTGLTPELPHYSLVLDGAAPDEQLQSFLVFSEAIMTVSPRHNRKAATVDNVSAAVWPHKRPSDREAEAKQEKQASDQFLAALGTRLRRYRTKFEREHYDWLTASKVAEDSERLRWLHKLASLVGKFPEKQPGHVDVLGA